MRKYQIILLMNKIVILQGNCRNDVEISVVSDLEIYDFCKALNIRRIGGWGVNSISEILSVKVQKLQGTN